MLFRSRFTRDSVLNFSGTSARRYTPNRYATNFDSRMSKSDKRLSPESHSSLMASMSPHTSPLPSSALGSVAATSDQDSPKASSREDKDALELPPVDRTSQATAMAIADLLP